MYYTGLTVADQVYLNGLFRSHWRLRTRLELMDLDHNILGDLSNRLVKGSVSIDSTADVQRMMPLELFDPNKDILDSADPRLGSAHPARMIRATYEVSPMDRSRLFKIPVFTGPVTKVDRSDSTLQVECSGKEVLSNGEIWSAFNAGANVNKVDLAISLMRSIGGENFFDMATTTSKTSKSQAITRDLYSLYGYVRSLLNTAGLQVFYDGRGYLRARTRPSAVQIAFTRAMMLDEPVVGYDDETLVNAVEVTGATPKGWKSPLTARRTAQSDHPLSPWALRRGGRSQYRTKFVQNTDLASQSAVNAAADRELAEGLLQSVEVTVPTRINPLMEEDDLISFATNDYTLSQRARKWSLPLVMDTPGMSIGYTMNVKPTPLNRSFRRL